MVTRIIFLAAVMLLLLSPACDLSGIALPFEAICFHSTKLHLTTILINTVVFAIGVSMVTKARIVHSHSSILRYSDCSDGRIF